MIISPDGETVSFKTEPQELFLAEKSGIKPNTVRIIDNDEYEMLNTHTPKKIIIQYKQEIFLRTLTNLHFAKLFGKVIVIFSWEHPHTTDHTHVEIELDSHSPLSHSMSINENLDETAPVLLPRKLIQDLGEHRGGRSHAEFISRLLEEHFKAQLQTSEEATSPRPHSVSTKPGDHNARQEEAMPSEEPSIHDRFAAITIGNGTLALLQSIAHGRTLNMVIKELYEKYMCTLAKERGLLHG